MRLALFQLDAAEASGGRQGLLRIEKRVRAARDRGADLVLLPELALPGYGVGAEAIRVEAERAPETLAHLTALASETGTSIALGLPILADGALRNAAICCRPGQKPVVYAKRFLYGSYERDMFSRGTDPSPIFEIAGLQVGFLVCFDVEFPESVRSLALAGADLVLVPTALPASEGACFIAQRLVPTRAFENGIFVAYADWCGADVAFSYQGLSVIAAPNGSNLAAAEVNGQAMLLADLDPVDFTAVRAANDYLSEMQAAVRRPANPSPE